MLHKIERKCFIVTFWQVSWPSPRVNINWYIHWCYQAFLSFFSQTKNSNNCFLCLPMQERNSFESTWTFFLQFPQPQLFRTSNCSFFTRLLDQVSLAHWSCAMFCCTKTIRKLWFGCAHVRERKFLCLWWESINLESVAHCTKYNSLTVVQSQNQPGRTEGHGKSV